MFFVCGPNSKEWGFFIRFEPLKFFKVLKRNKKWIKKQFL
ncbi:hypothetical protein LEP1GSC059_2078 [Leptospira noguchii serovar Panama str. CZ214]|uniref:Uncharacterized protein n=1 Tax=Leptospira noguchii serovar Panama str. CZ214 TaxID=1001595 RepID=T0FKH1_9LEPT|nr:hypothetical protein LEP1GSC059_2078 [Leptospira noguchii serovar Panama str. CZ214]